MRQILDHVLRALARFATQFFDSQKLRGFASSLASEVQEIEDAFFVLKDSIRSVANASGKTLDRIGALVAAPARGLKNDVQYRQRVNAQIAINVSSGDQSKVYELARANVASWAASGSCKIVHEGLGSYVIRCEPEASIINVQSEAIELAQMLADANPAGVRGIVISRSIVGNKFRFGTGATGVHGFGNGKLIGAYSFKG